MGVINCPLPLKVTGIPWLFKIPVHERKIHSGFEGAVMPMTGPRQSPARAPEANLLEPTQL